ncbi:acyltransferase family protein [Streptomyces sp. NPDC001568]|uniref:acyltransferase family protein n=1 Tax=Streptomyces sp. NPDC001568 TaxID=3364588 RepID=UPI0036A7312A
MLDPRQAAIRPGAALPSLTGMRFIAALLVFLAHMSAAGMFTDQLLNTRLDKYLGTLGAVGVSFFFVLSGFVLTWSARDSDRPGLFYRRRLAKIYPNHFVTWIAGLLLAVLAGTAVTGKEFLPGLFLVNAWFPEYLVIRGTNGAAWSLCVELVFYLTFPALLLWVKRIRPQRLWAWVGVMVLGAIAVAVIAESFLPYESLPGLKYGWWQFWFVYFLPVSRLFEFVIGILLARIVMSGRWIPVSRPVAALTLIPGYLGTVFLPGSYGLVLPLLIPLGLIVASGAHADATGRTSFLGGRTMVWLGEISFAFYMLHMVVAYHGPAAFGSGRQWDTIEATARIAGWLALTLALSWLLYRFVELPVMRRWSRPRARAASPTTPTPPATTPSPTPAPDGTPPARESLVSVRSD